MRLIPSPILPPLPSDDYSALRDQIAENGVETPLLVTAEGIIIDGHERFRACQEIGLRKFPIRVIGSLTEAERRERAIRLNVHRRHLTRAERMRLLEGLIREAPQKSSRELADACKVSQSTAARAKARVISGESDDSPGTIGRDGKTYRPRPKPAVGVETLQSATAAGRLLRTLGDQAPEGGVTLRRLRKVEYEVKLASEADSPLARTPPEITIKHGDFRRINWERWFGKVSLILTDPPWLSEHADLREPLAELCKRLLRPGGVLLCYCGQYYLPAFVQAFGKQLDYQWLIAAINDSGGTLRDQGNVHSAWRPVLLYSKGVLRSARIINDVIRTTQREKDLHPWQSPLSEAEHLVSTLSRPGDMIVDPCLGSGTVAAAVAKVGHARRFLGCDIDPGCVRIARRRVADALSTVHATA